MDYTDSVSLANSFSHLRNANIKVNGNSATVLDIVVAPLRPEHFSMWLSNYKSGKNAANAIEPFREVPTEPLIIFYTHAPEEFSYYWFTTYATENGINLEASAA